MRENRQYGFVAQSGTNTGRCIGGSLDGKLVNSTLSVHEKYRFHPLRTVHGISYGFWYPVDKTPVDIILMLAGNYKRPPRKRS